MIGKRRRDEHSDLLSSAKETMSKLKILAKKYLDKDIKTMVKHKVLDNTLDVTDEGLEQLAAFLVSHHKAEFAQFLREQEKDKDVEDDDDGEEIKAKKKK